MYRKSLLQVAMFFFAAFTSTLYAQADNYKVYTGEITEGDYIIVYKADGNLYALKAENASKRIAYDTLLPATDETEISDPDELLVWHISPNGQYYTVYNEKEQKYVAGTKNRNEANLHTACDTKYEKFDITLMDDEGYNFVCRGRADMDTANKTYKYLRFNGKDGGWGCYEQSTGGHLTLYKKDGESGPNGNETIIEGVKTQGEHASKTSNKSVVYDLQGRKVAKASSNRLYIKNNKKFIVK